MSNREIKVKHIFHAARRNFLLFGYEFLHYNITHNEDYQQWAINSFEILEMSNFMDFKICNF